VPEWPVEAEISRHWWHPGALGFMHDPTIFRRSAARRPRRLSRYPMLIDGSELSR
jgi:hypothetical protein